MADNSCLVVLCSCPEGEVAAQLASALVEARLAACVNRVPGVLSSFRWEGQVQHESEVLLIIKTTAGRLPELSAKIRDLHPYELPEIVAVPVTGGLDAYLDWVRASVA